MKSETNQFKLQVNKVINLSFIIITLLAIPLNIVIFFALKNSEHQIVRYIPPIFTFIVFLLSILRHSLGVKTKIWIFITLLFSVGLYCLLLGLIDVAGLWFLLVIVFVILVVPKKQALTVLLATITITTIAGLMLMSGRFPIPFRYDFYNCQTFCILTRLIHYVIISIIFYFIVSTINTYLKSTIVKLENEMEEKKALQNQIVEAVIQTEEKERSRIASDLHDGLGPVFSTARLYFQAYTDAKNDESKIEIKDKLEKIFDNGLSSISEISRNISPYELTNYGLVAALKNIQNYIAKTGQINFHFKYDKIQRFGHIVEFTLYRVINELINNTLKHSQATNLSLELKIVNENIEAMYSDDGKGFDVETSLKKNAGMGMRNMLSRIESLNGSILIESQLNKGMSVKIKLPYIITKNE